MLQDIIEVKLLEKKIIKFDDNQDEILDNGANLAPDVLCDLITKQESPIFVRN